MMAPVLEDIIGGPAQAQICTACWCNICTLAGKIVTAQVTAQDQATKPKHKANDKKRGGVWLAIVTRDTNQQLFSSYTSAEAKSHNWMRGALLLL
jgi:hypothetical protein